MTRLLLLWDVDQTLIEDGGVNEETYVRAFELLTGRPPAEWIVIAGRTERGMVDRLLAANGLDPAAYPWPDQEAALVKAVAASRAELARRGRALPGAAEALAAVAQQPEVIQSTLTGNVEANARVKLGAFGLDRWIDFAVGGYGSDSLVRGDLVPVAQDRAARTYGFEAARDTTVLVGDTPLDVEAGLVGGARVIGVGSGRYGLPELRSAGADAVVADLRDLPGLLGVLDRMRELGPVGPRPAEAR